MHSLRILAAAALAASTTAQAAALPLVDNFTAPGLNAAVWAAPESARYIDDKGRLNLGRWTFGGTASNSGTTVETFNLGAVDNVAPKSIKVTITAQNVDRVDGCAANPTRSSAYARTIGAFFNTLASAPTPGDMTGDVLAQASLQRNSDEPAGLVHVFGGVPLCQNADCSQGVSLAFVDLGTVNVGDPVSLQIEWVSKSSKFVFTRDGIAYDAPYTATPTFAAGRPFINMSIRNVVANCAAGRVQAGFGALFDNFGIGR